MLNKRIEKKNYFDKNIHRQTIYNKNYYNSHCDNLLQKQTFALRTRKRHKQKKHVPIQ